MVFGILAAELNPWYLGPVNSQHVFFIRGLSTYGRDVAKWSVFDFGPVYQHLAHALTERGIQFHPVVGLGAGSLPEIAERGARFLDQHPVWNDSDQPVHLFGHSAGGLVLRMLLRKLKRKPLSALTLATPHKGSRLAEIVANLPQTHRGSTMLLRSFGYNVRTRKHFFDELTPSGLAQVFAPEDWELTAKATRAGSIVCSSPRADWCLPLKAFYKIKAFDEFRIPSDGVVERDTQPWGKVIAELPVDHFRQVGLFRTGHQFEFLTDSIAKYFKSS